MKEIEEGIFYQSSHIKNIEIPNSVISIGKKAFGLCTALQSISIPESVVEISDEAFEKCSNLDTINLPLSLKKVGNNAFAKHYSHPSQPDTDIYYAGKESDWDKIEFGNGNECIFNCSVIHFAGKTTTVTTASTTSITKSTTATPTTTEPTENKSVGDINGDSKIDSKDAVLVLKSYAESLVNGKKSTDLTGDINGDKKVDSKDAVIILKYYAATLTGFTGTISEFK